MKVKNKGELMDTFIANIATFPTALFTTFMLVIIGFWLLTLIGMMDLEVLDIDIDVDADALQGMSALIVTLGFTGVPLTIVLSILGLVSWLVCYYAVHFGLFWADAGIMRYALGAVIAIGSFAVALPITRLVIKPLKKLFSKLGDNTSSKSLLGTTCTVRTTRVDDTFGEAQCLFNDAPLILKIRADTPNTFSRGDNVVIIEHDSEKQTYFVVSETEFNH